MLGLGGMFFGESFTDTRAMMIDNYNGAVKQWNATARNQFLEVTNQSVVLTSCGTSLGPLDCNPLPNNFTISETADSWADQNAPGVLSYDPLKLTIAPFPTITSSFLSSLSLSVRAEGVDGFSYSSSSYTVVKSKTYDSYDLGGDCKHYRYASDCNSQCIGMGGTWSYTTDLCTVQSGASSVCFQLTKGDSGQWKSASHVGCNYGSDNNNWSPISMKTLRNGQVSLAGVTITFRSADDPWIKMQDLTEGTGSFGLTTTQKRGLGIGLLAGGAFLTFVPLVLCCYFFRSTRAERVTFTQTYTSYSAVQPSYVQPSAPPAYNPNYQQQPQQQYYG